MEYDIHINLGKLEDNILYLLPGDKITLRGNNNGIVSKVEIDTRDNTVSITVKSDTQYNGETSFMIEHESPIGPWYQELCETNCKIQDCEMCKSLCGWTSKKFVCPGDSVSYDGVDMTVESIELDGHESDPRLVFNTGVFEKLYIDDPFMKIIRRGPLRCIRPGLKKDPSDFCNICFKRVCKNCILNGG